MTQSSGLVRAETLPFPGAGQSKTAPPQSWANCVRTLPSLGKKRQALARMAGEVRQALDMLQGHQAGLGDDWRALWARLNEQHTQVLEALARAVATNEELSRALDTLAGQREHLVGERDRLRSAWESLVFERQQLTQERDALRAHVAVLLDERLALLAHQETLLAHQETLLAHQEALEARLARFRRSLPGRLYLGLRQTFVGDVYRALRRSWVGNVWRALRKGFLGPAWRRSRRLLAWRKP